jgi:hypothetical protein
MADFTDIVAGRRWNSWRIAMWGTAAVLLSLPAIAMQLNAPGVDWTLGDFLTMGMMLGIACGLCELVAWASASGAFRIAAVVAIGAAFLTVWVNLAVGMIGSEHNPYNQLFGGVLALALAGSAVARFQARGMAWAMVAAGASQAALAIIGLGTDPLGAKFSMVFALPWLLSALLFRKAAREQRLQH